jgi:hypothetical protein
MTAPKSIAERLMRWTCDEVHSELWIARKECEIVVWDLGTPICRKHHPNTDDCREAAAAVNALRLQAVLGTED